MFPNNFSGLASDPGIRLMSLTYVIILNPDDKVGFEIQ